MKILALVAIALTLVLAASVGAEIPPPPVAPAAAPPTFPWADLRALIEEAGFPSQGGCPNGEVAHILRAAKDGRGYIVFLSDANRVVIGLYDTTESPRPAQVAWGRLTKDGVFTGLSWHPYVENESPCEGLFLKES